MEKTLKFCIDHFSIGTPRRMEASQVLKDLGFVTGDTSKDRSTHFVLDNTLVEVNFREEGKPIVWLDNSIPAGVLPRVHSIRLSNAGVDAEKARAALTDAGIPGVGQVNKPTSQRVKYGKVLGTASYQTIFIRGLEPFTDILFGITTQLSKHLIVNQDSKFIHTNQAKKVKSLTFYCESKEVLDTASECIEKLNAAMKNVEDHGRNIDEARLVDAEAYRAEFGVEPRATQHFPAVAATFGGCDLEYVEEAAADAGLASFTKNGKLYVDTREELGIFCIFES